MYLIKVISIKSKWPIVTSWHRDGKDDDILPTVDDSVITSVEARERVAEDVQLAVVSCSTGSEDVVESWPSDEEVEVDATQPEPGLVDIHEPQDPTEEEDIKHSPINLKNCFHLIIMSVPSPQSSTLPTLVKTVYCTACSIQTGKNKKSVHHEDLVITGNNIKATYKNPKNKVPEGQESTEPKKIIGYVAILDCPVSKRKISTFIDKSKAQELLASINPPPTNGDSPVEMRS